MDGVGIGVREVVTDGGSEGGPSGTALEFRCAAYPPCFSEKLRASTSWIRARPERVLDSELPESTAICCCRSCPKLLLFFLIVVMLRSQRLP